MAKKQILDVSWFTGIHSVGMVTIKNEVGEVKTYIGKVDGRNEKADTQEIMDYGSRVTPEILEGILRYHNKKKGGKK